MYGQAEQAVFDRLLAAHDERWLMELTLLISWYVGIGTFADLPWAPYGAPGDDAYRGVFDIAGKRRLGNVAAPVKSGNGWAAPDDVSAVLGSLLALGTLAAFDVVFLVASWLMFEWVLEP